MFNFFQLSRIVAQEEFTREHSLVMQRASAPQLSLAARYEALVASIHAPDFPKYAARLAPGYSENQKKVLTLQAFQESPEYKPFKHIIQTTLKQLDEIANAHEQNQVEPAPAGFQILGEKLLRKARLGQINAFGASQIDLYQQALPNAQKLLRIHDFTRQHPRLLPDESERCVQASISELSNSLHVCAPGIANNFEETVNSIRNAVFTPGLSERFKALRLQMIRSAITESVHRYNGHTPHLGVVEMHRVAAWQNYFAEQLNLPHIHDGYAIDQYTSDQVQAKHLNDTLPVVAAQPTVAKVMATEILQDAHALWQKAQAKGETDFAANCSRLLEQLQIRHGPLKPHAMIEMDENLIPVGFHTNPTLLALNIIDRFNNTDPSEFPEQACQVWTAGIDKEHTEITMHTLGRLAWMEKKQVRNRQHNAEKMLISAQHLNKSQLKNFFSSLAYPTHANLLPHAVLHEMLVNDWGASWPHCKTQEFDPQLADYVFVHLAMGLAHGQQVGSLDSSPLFVHSLSKCLHAAYNAPSVSVYSPQHFLQLLESTHAYFVKSLNFRSLSMPPLKQLFSKINDPNINPNLYRAMLEFNWKHYPSLATKQLSDCKALRSENATQGLVFIDLLKTNAPNELANTLRKHIATMRSPEIFLAFLDAGAEVGATAQGERTLLSYLMDSHDDTFVHATLIQLLKRNISIEEIATLGFVQVLNNRLMTKSSEILEFHSQYGN